MLGCRKHVSVPRHRYITLARHGAWVAVTTEGYIHVILGLRRRHVAVTALCQSRTGHGQIGSCDGQRQLSACVNAAACNVR
jgi:hypothetical protein